MSVRSYLGARVESGLAATEPMPPVMSVGDGVGRLNVGATATAGDRGAVSGVELADARPLGAAAGVAGGVTDSDDGNDGDGVVGEGWADAGGVAGASITVTVTGLAMISSCLHVGYNSTVHVPTVSVIIRDVFIGMVYSVGCPFKWTVAMP